MPKEVTREEFEQILLEFFHWSGSRSRPLSGWFMSLEEHAHMAFNRAYERDYPKKAGTK